MRCLWCIRNWYPKNCRSTHSHSIRRPSLNDPFIASSFSYTAILIIQFSLHQKQICSNIHKKFVWMHHETSKRKWQIDESKIFSKGRSRSLYGLDEFTEWAKHEPDMCMLRKKKLELKIWWFCWERPCKNQGSRLKCFVNGTMKDTTTFNLWIDRRRLRHDAW